MTSEDERILLATRAKKACRSWALLRVLVSPRYPRDEEAFRAFDREMFALGEVVWSGGEGEVARVGRES